MIKCACGESGCGIQVRTETEQDHIGLWLTDKDGKDTLMYLDANTTVALIHELQDRLIQLATGEKRVHGL